MKSGPRSPSRTPAQQSDRRLLGGLLVSLLLHALLLLLQFGVPGQGAPSPAPQSSFSVTLANLPPAPSAPLPPLAPPLPVDSTPPPPPPPAPPQASTGFQLVDPVVAPAPVAVPAPTLAKRAVKKGKPRKARRISPPMPALDVVADTTPVITQDSVQNDFVVPLARPEDAEQKTPDIKDARAGEDDGDAADTAALEAEAARAGKIKAEAEAEAVRLAEQALREEQEKADLKAQQEQEQQRLAAIERDAREQAQKKAEQEAQASAAQLAAQQQAEALKAEQRRAEQARSEQRVAEQKLAEQQRVEQQRVEQQKAAQDAARLREQQLAQQQRAEQARLEQQRAEQARAEQARAEQARAEQARAEQARAEQARAEQARAEQARAEQARAEQSRAEQQRAAEQAAAQRAADQAAAQRARDLAGAQGGTQRGAQPGAGGGGGPGAGAGGTPGGAKIPKDLLGSDLGNRARELVKGLDLLKGAPPAPRMPGERRIAVGAGERDLPLKMYVESWREKIQRNGLINYPRSWADEVRIDPLVSVAVRSDGSVEEVTIIVSSGRADMDEAVRRIVRVNARFAPFPPAIAERYDVIDIRRVWRFDEKLILMEELR